MNMTSTSIRYHKYKVPHEKLKGSVWSKKSFPFFAENMIIRSLLNLWFAFYNETRNDTFLVVIR